MSMSTFGISFYSMKCWIAFVKLLVRALLLSCYATVRRTFLSVLALLRQYSELNCEENKHEVGLFDKQ